MEIRFSFPFLLLLFVACAFGAPAQFPSPQPVKSKSIDPGLMAKADSANRRAKVKM